MHNAVKILLGMVALAALALSSFLVHRMQDGVTLKPLATGLMWGGFALGIGIFILLGVTKRSPG